MTNVYLSYNDFLADVSIKYETQIRNDEKDIRYGQLYFNLLFNEKPAIAIELRESLLDPYYRSNIHPDTHLFVEGRWDS